MKNSDKKVIIENIELHKAEIKNYSRDNLQNDEFAFVKSFLKLLEENKLNSEELDTSLLEELDKSINNIIEDNISDLYKANFIKNIKEVVNSFLTDNVEKVSIESLQNKIIELETKINNYQEENIDKAIDKEIGRLEEFYKDVQEGIFSLDQKLSDVEEKEKKLEEIEIAISGDINQRNFELLSKGFKAILGEKKVEKDDIVIWLKIFGTIIIALPLLVIVSEFKEWKIFTHISVVIPLITIELFLIYYFKIFLHNYNSLKGQMLQIDTKRSLLGFISDYIRYKDSNKISDTSLDKLENIIFSKISPDMKEVPSSPDVIGLIEKIVKTFSKG